MAVIRGIQQDHFNEGYQEWLKKPEPAPYERAALLRKLRKRRMEIRKSLLEPDISPEVFQERLLETNRIEGEMAALGMRLHMTTESYSGPHHSAPHAEVREGEVGWLPTYQSMPRRVVFFPVRGNKDQARIFYEGESLDNLKRGHRYSLHSICRNEKDALEKILTRVKADLAREEQLRQRIEGRLAEIAAEEV